MTSSAPRPPRRDGETIVITGGTAGLGYFTAERLALTGARVVVTARDPGRADRALASIRAHAPGADLSAVALDLTDLTSVETAADELADLGRIDALVLNAGLTTPPSGRTLTRDGLELTLATNVVGHTALLAHLWPTLLATIGRTPRPVRVVGLGSLATRVLPFDPASLAAPSDLTGDDGYRPFAQYALSKHAVHAWITELARRVTGTGVQALLAHPGYAVDGLTPERPGIVEPGRFERLPFAQGKHDGARPTLRAVLDPRLGNGAFVGPRWVTRGEPVQVSAVRSSSSPEAGAAVWSALAGVTGGFAP
ncbi:SDR family NAD(P)-dependent oxidoreductase [Serinibacter arcticus]|uniref:SDR family NAD(P)-dependent oxidoreductase n=1 Tax=Serinibacter arcticus TaxID=1655435 RepID=UPI001304FD84|nr:SDR family NAD(P)-dependent oxidoreductase [Serinibacter arcticus]